MIQRKPTSHLLFAGLLILVSLLILTGCNSSTPNYDQLFSNFDPELKAQIMTNENLGLEGGRWYAATGKFTNKSLLEQGMTENAIQMAFFSAGGENTVYRLLPHCDRF